MIGYISGRVLAQIGDQLLIKTPSGVGYLVYTNPRSTFHIGDQVDLFTLHVIREDKQELYSFDNLEDRNGIEKLLKVDGVGPKTAAMVIYTLTWSHVQRAVSEEDYKTLSTVKGLGAKTAKKIVLELKGAQTDISNLSENPDQKAQFDTIIAGLVSMGYKKNDITPILNRLATSTLFDPSDTVGSIKKILKELSS